MVIITNKNDNRIISKGKKIDYLENGYPRIIEKNVAYPINLVNVYEVEAIPDYVVEEKYCYDGNEFIENKNYIEARLEITNEELQVQINDIQLALCELYENMGAE